MTAWETAETREFFETDNMLLLWRSYTNVSLDRKDALAVRLVCGIPYVSTTKVGNLRNASLTHAIELV